MPAEELFALLGKVTVARLLEREDFTKRMKADQPISSLELLYPVLQGYDSVAVALRRRAGGTDQKFNLLFARDIQRAYDVPEQSIMTMPILPGTDGRQKMSKSLGNYVGVTDPPEEMFGKLMSVPDEAMGTYYELLLGEEEPGGHPAEAKRALARRIVERFHGDGGRGGRRGPLRSVHVEHGLPDEMPELDLSSDPGCAPGMTARSTCPPLISAAFEISTSEARRLLSQGAVKLDGEALDGERLDLPRGRAQRKGPAGGQAALPAPHRQPGLLNKRADRGLYSAVALASDHEESRLVRGAQIGRDRGRVVAGPLDRGAFFREPSRGWRRRDPSTPPDGL